MKLKYIIPAFMALFALALTSCNDINEPTVFEEIQVSSSLVCIDISGGSGSIAVKAKEEWSVDVDEMPEWLTANPMTGPAGQSAITFTADPTTSPRDVTIHIVCAGKRQPVKIDQLDSSGAGGATEATCADVIAGPEGKTFRVTGTCVQITNTEYGNWYLEDATGRIQIYGTLDRNGRNGKNNSIADWGIEVGDVITVEGPKKLYNTTVELVDVTIINIDKSLIQVTGYEPESGIFPTEGGDVKVKLSSKNGTAVTAEVADDAKQWLTLSSITSGAEPVATFHATANPGGARSGVVTFKTTDASGKESSIKVTLNQNGSIVDVPIADFLAAEVGEAQYRLTGVITELYASDSQGKSFYIRDYSGTVLVYRAEGFIESGAKVGDVVTVTGKRGAYNNNPQMVSGTVEDHITVTAVSLDEFLAKPDASDVYYMVTGTIDEVVNPTYGNLYLKDGETRVYVYGTYPGWGASGENRKNWLETAGIKVGDKLTVIGVKSTYNDAPQVANSIYFSHTPAN